MNYLLPEEIRILLTNWALRPDSPADLKEIFGADDSRAHSFVEQIRGGDFSWVPTVEVLSSGILNGALGAYARSTATIYLSETCAEERVSEVLLEEIGHHIDALFNSNETPGDEGTLFSAAVLGLSLSEDEIESILNEDDSATITIAGRAILVECASDTLGINTSSTLSPASPYTLGSAYKVSTLTGSTAYKLTGNANATNQLLADSLDADVSLIAGTAARTTLIGGKFNNWLDASKNPVTGTAMLVSGPGSLLTTLVDSVDSGSTSLRVSSTPAFLIGQTLNGNGLAYGTTVAAVDRSTLTSVAAKNATTLAVASVAGYVIGETLAGPAFATGTTVVGIDTLTSSLTLSTGLLSSLASGSQIIGDGRILLSTATVDPIDSGAEFSAPDLNGNTLIGGAGKSFLDASQAAGFASLISGTGATTMLGGSGTTTLNGGNALDARSATAATSLVAGTGDTTMRGGSSTNFMDATYSMGNASLFAGAGTGATTMLGGAGSSTLDGRSSTATQYLAGGTGDNTIYGGTRNASLIGGSGNNLIVSGDAASGYGHSLVGGLDSNLNNTLIGGTGKDIMMGGDGFNTLISGSTTIAHSLWGNGISSSLVAGQAGSTILNKYGLPGDILSASQNLASDTTLDGRYYSLVGGFNDTLDLRTSTLLSGTAKVSEFGSTDKASTNYLVSGSNAQGSQSLVGHGGFNTLVAGQGHDSLIVWNNDKAKNSNNVYLFGQNNIANHNIQLTTLSGAKNFLGLNYTAPAMALASTATIGSNVLSVTSAAGFVVGEQITGTGITSGTTITAITNNTNKTILLESLSSAATVPGSKQLLHVASTEGYAVGETLSTLAGGGITAGTWINAISVDTTTLVDTLAAGSQSLDVDYSTALSFVVGETIKGYGIADGTKVSAIDASTVSTTAAKGATSVKLASVAGFVVGEGMVGSAFATGTTVLGINTVNSTISLSSGLASALATGSSVRGDGRLSLSGGTTNDLEVGSSLTGGGYLSISAPITKTLTAGTTIAGGATVTLSNAITDDIASGSSLSGSALHTAVSSTLNSGSYAVGAKLLKVSSTTGFAVGDSISGRGITNGTKIAAIDTLNSNISLSAGLNTSLGSGTQITVNTINILDSDLAYLRGGGTLQAITNYGPGSASMELGSNASKLGVSTVIAGNNGDIVTELSSYSGTLSLKGGSGNDLLAADNKDQLIRGDFQGGSGDDTIQLNTSSTLGDTFFASLGADIEALKLSDSIGSSNQVSLAAKATELGITSVYGGAGRETISQLINSGSLYLNTGDNNDLIRVVNTSYLSGDVINGGNGVDTLQVGGLSTLANITLGDGAFAKLSNLEVLTLNGGVGTSTDGSQTYGSSNVTFGALAYNTGIQSVYGSDGGNTFTQNRLNGSLTTLGPAVSAGATSIRVTTNTNLRVGDVIESSGIIARSAIVGISQDTSTLRAAASSGSTLLAVGSAGTFAIGETLSGTGIASGTAITAIDRSTLLESAASASRTLHSANAGGFVVGESLSGTGITSGTSIASITLDRTTLSSSIASGSQVLKVASTSSFIVGESLYGSGITSGTTISAIDRSTLLETLASNSSNIHVGSTAGFILGDIISGTGIASGSILLSTSIDSTTLLESATSGSTTLHAATSGGFVVGETLSGIGIAAGTKITNLLQDSTTLRTLAGPGSTRLSVASAAMFVVEETIYGTNIASGTSVTAIDRSTLLDSIASGSRTLHVGNTGGFVVGESLSGSGIPAGVTVVSIDPDTFVLLDSAAAGSSYLHYNPASADKLSIGETLFGSVFATGTTITSIDTINSIVTLSKNMLDTLAAGSTVFGGGILSLSGGTTSSIASGSQVTGQGYLSLSTGTSGIIASATSITGGYQLTLSGGTSGSLASGASVTGGGVLTLSKNTTASLASGSAVTGTGHLSLSSGVSGNISSLSTITGAGGVLSLSAGTSSSIASGSQITGQGYLSLSTATTTSIASGSQVTGEYLLSLSSGLDNSIASGSQIVAALPVHMWGGLGNDVFNIAYTNLNESLTGYSVAEMATPSLMASDTLNTVIVTGQASINGANFLNYLTGIQRVQLNSSSGNSVTLSGNGTNTIAGGTGIGTLVAGAGSDTIDASGYRNSVTLNATAAKFANKVYPADSLLGSYTKASSFYFSDAGVFGLSTVKGGIANDTVVLNATANLLDQAFTNKSDIDAISLQAGGSVLIGNMAMTAGIDSFYGGNQSDTFTQTTAYSKAAYINGGGGSNTYLIYNTTLLSGLNDSLSPLDADTLQRDTIIGGDLGDTLIINDTFTSNIDPNLTDALGVTSLNGYDLRYVQNIDVLSLAGSAFVSLSSADINTGIRSILGGVGDDTFITEINNSYLRSGTGNSYLQAGHEGDYAWGVGKSAYIYLSGGGNGGTSALVYTNTLVAYGNEDTLDAGSNGDRVEAWGQSDLVLSGSGDTTYIYNTDARINAGSNNRIIFDDGIYSDGTQFSTQSLNYTSSTIYGGASSDTLQFNQDITLNNSFYNIATNSVGALWLMGDGDSNVTLGESADFRGIATVVAGLGNATVDGTAYTNRQLNYDLTYLDATNSQDSLVGSNVLYNPLNGTRFLIDAVSELTNNTLVGNDMSFYNGRGTSATLCGIDSLTYVATTINGSGVTLNDAVFNSDRQRNIDVLVLNSNYNAATGSLSGNQVQIGTNFASTNLSTIVGSSSGDQYVLTSTFGQNSTYVGGSGPLGGYISGGSGGDKFSLAGNYLDSNGPAADKITLNGGGSVDGLYFTTSNINLYDSSSRSDLANVKNMEGLFFDSINPGTNSLIIDKYATLSGLASVRGGSGIFSALTADAALATTTLNVTNGSLFAVGQQVGGTGFAYGTTISSIVGNVLTISQATTASLKSGAAITTNGDTLTQTGNFANAFSMIGGNGNDLFKLSSSSYLGGAGGNDTYIAGNSGYDTLWISKDSTLTDAMFAGISGIEALSLSGASSVVLDSNAKSAGFSWVYGSSLKATIDNNPATLGDTISHSVNGRAVTMVGALGTDFFSLGNATLLANQNSTLAGDSISGGVGNDTLQVTSGADPFYDSLFGRVSAVEAMKLTGTDSISTLFLDSNASATGITIVAGSDKGNVITQGSGNAKSISLVGGSSADMFNVATRAQFGSDTFVGDLGADTIYVASGGGTYGDSDFSKISGIEIISLGGSSAVTASLGATAMGAGFTGVYGGAGFNSLFQTSAFTNALTLKGGDAGNSFAIASSTLIGNDTIIGGSGIDSLSLLTDSQTLTDALFVKSLYSIDVLKTGNGTNSVVAGSNAQSSLLTIVGGTGADTIVTSDYSAMTITGGGGADSLITGSKNDYFTFATATDLGAVATVNGGSGNNTVGMTTDAQTVLDTAFTKYTNVDLFKTANGANNITFGYQAEDAGLTSFVGGSGADTLNASLMSANLNITGNGGADYLLAGSGNDLFNFGSLGDMTLAASVTGALGTDTVSLSGDSAMSATIADTAFTKLSGIEVFKTGDGSNVVTLASLASAAGISTVIGGTGRDLFNVTGAILNANTTSIVGGQGTDIVALTTDSQTIADSLFGSYISPTTIFVTGNLNSIEVFQTANGTNSLTLGSGAIGEGATTFIGGSGNDSFNVSSTFVNTAKVSLNGGAGTNNLALTTDGMTIVDTTFAKFSSFQVFQTANGSGTNTVNLGANASLTGIATFSGGSAADNIIVSAGYFSSTSTASLLGGSGTDTLTLATDAQTIADAAFTKLSSMEVIQTANGANSLTLASNASAAGISTVVGGTGNDTFNASALTTNIAFNGNGGSDSFLGGSGNDQFLFSTTGNLTLAAAVSGSTGSNSVVLTSDSQTIIDSNFSNKITSIQTLKTSNGTNSITIGTNAKTSGVGAVVGGTGNDSFNASSYTTSVTLDGGGAATVADTLTGGAGSTSDLFILGNAGSTSTYYGTTTTGTANYAIVTSLASNQLVSGQASSDKLQLNQADATALKYTLGASAGGVARTTTHFGLYDNSKFVGDITTSGFTVATNGAEDTAFLTAANNHVTYV